MPDKSIADSTTRMLPPLKYSMYLKYFHDARATEEEHEMAFSSRRIEAHKWTKGKNSFWEQLPTNTISLKPDEIITRRRKRSKLSMNFRNQKAYHSTDFGGRMVLNDQNIAT